MRARGVCAVSSGNHAQAVTLAAGLCGSHAVILMPSDAPALKRAATEGYGAEVISFDRYRDDREQLVRELAAERGLALVHPFDDPLVMAGQGTVALELLEQAGELDAVVVPVGGGGLISGCATVVKALLPRRPGDRSRAGGQRRRGAVAGQRPARAGARWGARSPTASRPTSPGELTWPVIAALVDEVVTVTDEQIVDAMRLAVRADEAGGRAQRRVRAGGADLRDAAAARASGWGWCCPGATSAAPVRAADGLSAAPGPCTPRVPTSATPRACLAWANRAGRLPVHAAAWPARTPAARPRCGGRLPGVVAALREQLVGAVDDQVLGAGGDRVGQLPEAAQRVAIRLGRLRIASAIMSAACSGLSVGKRS